MGKGAKDTGTWLEASGNPSVPEEPTISAPGAILHARRADRAPKVVVVVLNWNGWLDTVECVESLFRSDYPNLHVVVCDNRSSDESLTRLKEWAQGILEVESAVSEAGHRWAYRPIPKPLQFAEYDCTGGRPNFRKNDPRLTFIQTGANLGYAGGNNVGIEYGLVNDADYVWILNNDTVVGRETLSRMVSHAQEDSAIGIVGSKLLQYRTPDTIQALGGGSLDQRWGKDDQFGRGLRNAQHRDEALELEHVIGASMLVRAATIRDVGLMEESYFLYREETDWCIQMRLKGWRLTYCPGASVWHKEGHSIGFKSLLHDYYSVRNMLFLIRKFYPSNLPTAIAFLAFITISPKIARLQFKRLKYVLKAFYDFGRGVQGRGDLLPDFQALARKLAQDESPHVHGGIREKLAAVDFRAKRGAPPPERAAARDGESMEIG